MRVATTIPQIHLLLLEAALASIQENIGKKTLKNGLLRHPS